MIENILKGNSDLRQLSSTENLFHREGSNKSSNLSLIKVKNYKKWLLMKNWKMKFMISNLMCQKSLKTYLKN